MEVRRFRVVVPEMGVYDGRPQPVWRVGSVLRFCLGLARAERVRVWRHGGVAVNGAPVVAQHIHCYPGDVVEAWYPEATSSVRPEPQWLLAVDKPAGQLTHPARSERQGTIANAVAARYRIEGGSAPSPVRLVHRLDRDTSGVLLCARDAATARRLAQQRADGTLQRVYLALVAGRPPRAGAIATPLGRDPEHRTRQRAQIDGAPARTTYQVVQYGPAATLVAAGLHTGRTHQLRAHFASAGHPLLGDALYGGPALPGLTRQALHAWRTRLRHPVSGEHLTIVAPLPPDFRTASRTTWGGLSPSSLPHAAGAAGALRPGHDIG
jgi:RluA family pseudouridine synthase